MVGLNLIQLMFFKKGGNWTQRKTQGQTAYKDGEREQVMLLQATTCQQITKGDGRDPKQILSFSGPLFLGFSASRTVRQ